MPISVAEEVVVPPAERVAVSRVLDEVLEPGGEMEDAPPRGIWVIAGVV